MSRLALAIRVPDDARLLRRLRRTCIIPLHGRPLQLTIPGGILAVVQSEGHVALLGKSVRLVGPAPVKLLNGNTWVRGYELHFTPLRRLPPTPLSIRWRAVGQFRYVDPSTWVSTIVGEDVRRKDDDYLEEHAEVSLGESRLRRRPFMGGIPGRELDDPESRLVKAYVEWLRAEKEFAHYFLPSPGLHCDLFDSRRWRLIEAKVRADRHTLRTALGQLLDYKRFFARAPSLGVLLAEKPSPACLAYLSHYRVTAVWRTPAGRFHDSSENAGWSQGRRRGTA